MPGFSSPQNRSTMFPPLRGCPTACLWSFTVIPAPAGIQVWHGFLDSRRRGNDGLGLFSDRLLGRLAGLLLCAALCCGCITVKPRLFPDYSAPLEEYTLEGKGADKMVLIPVRGMITSDPKRETWGFKPSPLQETVSHLELAAADPRVKAVILQLDTPGGTVTASDILYREVLEYKERTQATVVAAMMNLATSGGYYVALAGDRIVAHPTTVTGSIGVVFVRPQVAGLMNKIGVGAEVTKSGEHKDMGSPFRSADEIERGILQEMIDNFNQRFLDLVKERRRLDPTVVHVISDGRIYSAERALALGLIDRIGYLHDAIAEARQLAGLPSDARVVVYRRSEFHNDNRYNTFTGEGSGDLPRMLDFGLAQYLGTLQPGFFYLWMPEYGH